MTILSMEAKIKELEAELEESKKELAALKENYISDEAEGRWIPREGELYYTICAIGEVNAQHFNGDLDLDMWNIGNCFKTLREAEFMIEKLKVYAQLRKYTESKDRYWGNGTIHYCLSYDYYTDEIFISSYETISTGCNFYFGTKDAAEAAIKAIGAEKLKTYLFNVRTQNIKNSEESKKREIQF